MGLPIWRDPEEDAPTRDAVKNDPTAAARSSIRRRPSVHGRRGARPPLPRESSRRPQDQNTFAFSQAREWRRSEQRRIPLVPTLLESADTRSIAVPALNTFEPIGAEPQSFEARHRDRDARYQRRAAQLHRELVAGEMPEHWRHWTYEDRSIWLDQRIARQTRSPSPTSSTSPLPPSATSRSAGRQSSSRGRVRPVLSRPSPRYLAQAHEADGPILPVNLSEDAETLAVPGPGDLMRRFHPLRHSWRAESPIDGLGDRIRSPTPANGWETMRTTITPDENLPSAESSFASAAVSDSFNSRGTNSTEPERFSTSGSSRRTSEEGENQSDSASSIDPDDLCNDEERQATASFAQDMFFFEQGSVQGNERVARHRADLAGQGNRYALFDESESVELGFRLINEALDTPEGRERVFQLSQSRPGPTPEHQSFEEWIFAHRRTSSARTRLAHIMDDEPPNPHPERYGRHARAAVHEARSQVHDYFRRMTADALTGTDAVHRGSTADSPPPRYERLAEEDGIISPDGPERTISPSSLRRPRDMVDALFNADEPDLDGVRRIVERLAQRDDIPDEWWTSVGLARHLNQSQSRVRSRSPDRRSILSGDDSRVTAERVNRWTRNPRL